MKPDPFASSTISLALAWVCAAPVLLGIIGAFAGMLFEKTSDEVPRWFVAWLAVCLLIFSPFRYAILQVIIAVGYPVQSIRAFMSVFLLGLYVPIVFGLLYFVGIGAPLLVTMRLAFGKLRAPIVTASRLVAGAVVAPVAMLVGYGLFFWLLPFGADTVHWLRAKDVIGATNGPAAVAYSVALKHFMPLPVRSYYTDVTQTDGDMLRNHVASYYLGDQAEADYVKAAFPDLYSTLITQKQ